MWNACDIVVHVCCYVKLVGSWNAYVGENISEVAYLKKLLELGNNVRRYTSAKPGEAVQCCPVLASAIVFIVRVHLWSAVTVLSQYP